MPERIKEILESLPPALTGAAAALGTLWAAVWSRRTTKAEAEKKEAEATAAAAVAKREAERLESEAWAMGFSGLKDLVAYLVSENADLRTRVAGLEKRVQELQAAHRNCEAETARLRQELAGLKDRAAQVNF
jgi:chromosome segregation ATPase